jgi:hypothetical protein
MHCDFDEALNLPTSEPVGANIDGRAPLLATLDVGDSRDKLGDLGKTAGTPVPGIVTKIERDSSLVEHLVDEVASREEGEICLRATP